MVETYLKRFFLFVILPLVSIGIYFSFSVSPTQAQFSDGTINEIQGKKDDVAVDSNLIAQEDLSTEGSIEAKLIDWIQKFLVLLGLILILLILWAGYQILFSGGNADKIEKGKATLFNAIIGLTVVMISYSATLFLLSNISKVFSKAQEGEKCNVDADCDTGLYCANSALSARTCKRDANNIRKY